MHLINIDSLKFSNFNDDQVPVYAILSHTWGEEGVVFNDMNPDKSLNYETGRIFVGEMKIQPLI
jgi:hypothetical protein